MGKLKGSAAAWQASMPTPNAPTAHLQSFTVASLLAIFHSTCAPLVQRIDILRTNVYVQI
jgi:hypothetical protein